MHNYFTMLLQKSILNLYSSIKTNNEKSYCREPNNLASIENVSQVSRAKLQFHNEDINTEGEY